MGKIPPKSNPVEREIREFKETKKRFLILEVTKPDRDPLTQEIISPQQYCRILKEDGEISLETVEYINEHSEYIKWCYDKLFKQVFGYNEGVSNE